MEKYIKRSFADVSEENKDKKEKEVAYTDFIGDIIKANLK